jgi:hypothetical protein
VSGVSARAALFFALWLMCLACGSEPRPSTEPRLMTREELLKPETCRECHETHYREWAGSMHAYAAEDPVFLAMNRRGQEATDGALGSFCVNCHAPLAVREGKTSDGLNLDEVAPELKGVTCYFCHNVEAVEGTHDNPLRLSNDQTLRGGIAEPVENSAHRSEYSALFATRSIESATLCGSCHDVVTPSPPAPAEVALERTFSEWQSSIFAPPQALDETAALSCNGCHMRPFPNEVVADAKGVRPRTRHAHDFPGVDVSLSPFPDTGDPSLDAEISEQQAAAVTSLLDSTLRIEICVLSRFTGDASISVTLDNAGAGHHFPSGAAQDRRLFVELRAFADGETEPFYESGVVPEGDAAATLDDPDLWLLHDRIFDAEGNPVHLFWEAASYRAGTLAVATSADPLSPGYVAGHALREFPRTGVLPFAPDRVTVRVRLEPIGREILADLVASGHLDPEIPSRMPTHVLLPNRHLGTAASAPESLRPLGELSFEWSEATRTTGNFTRVTRPNVMGEEECIGMPGRRVR